MPVGSALGCEHLTPNPSTCRYSRLEPLSCHCTLSRDRPRSFSGGCCLCSSPDAPASYFQGLASPMKVLAAEPVCTPC